MQDAKARAIERARMIDEQAYAPIRVQNPATEVPVASENKNESITDNHKQKLRSGKCYARDLSFTYIRASRIPGHSNSNDAQNAPLKTVGQVKKLDLSHIASESPEFKFVCLLDSICFFLRAGHIKARISEALHQQ